MHFSKAVRFIKKHWSALIIGGAVVVIIIGFIAGYRIGPGFILVRNGHLVIENLPEGSLVYTDQIRRHAEKNGKVKIALAPGSHTVIIDSLHNQPWNELFVINDGEDTNLHPLFIPVPDWIENKNVPQEERADANTALWNATLPTKARPLMAYGGCATVYVSGNQIIVEATSTAATDCVTPSYLCSTESCTPVIAYTTADVLRSLALFPGRDDALVVVSGGLLYVLEIDPRDPQFFAPLYRGTFVRAVTTDTSIIASDGTRLFSISLAP